MTIINYHYYYFFKLNIKRSKSYHLRFLKQFGVEFSLTKASRLNKILNNILYTSRARVLLFFHEESKEILET